MPNHPRIAISTITLASLLVLAQAGCVALNIPSRRYHDPGDHGGLFGSWRKDAAHGDSQAMRSVDGANGGFPGDGQPCGDPACEHWDGCDGSEYGMQESVKPPEIPWPRFHPVPTRPIFGSQAAP